MILVPITRRSSSLSAPLDRYLDEALQSFLGAPQADAPASARVPALDVAETAQAYVVRLDLPGVGKDDVTVDIEGRRVTVQATLGSEAESKEGARWLHRERSQSSYARSFTLPQEVQQSEAVARLDAGVLTLTLPKRVAARITVN